MAEIRPRIAISYGRINEPIRVPVSDALLNPITQSFLITNTVSGVTALKVQNAFVFNENQVLAIGEEGNQVSELAKTATTSAVSGQTVTLAATTGQNHSAGSWVKVIPYDQVEVSWASTSTGAKTVLLTTNIAIGLLENRYNDTANDSGYYFARYKNSITGSFSSYSDAAPYDGYTLMSARNVIDNALEMINKKTSDVLSDEFFFLQINNCQIETLREFKRWSFMQKFSEIITKTSIGTWRVPLPTDVDDQNTTKSIYNFRIGKELDMIWVDKQDWNDVVGFFPYTTTASAASAGATSIVLTSSSDFNSTGTVDIRGNAIEYTANNENTNTLTVSALTTAISAGVDVFQSAGTGDPLYYTTWGGYLYHWPITNRTYAGRNYYLDYYKKLTPITTDTDQIVLPDPTVVQYYCAWKALLKLANGEPTSSAQGMLELYLTRREKMKAKESLNREFYLLPDR